MILSFINYSLMKVLLPWSIPFLEEDILQNSRYLFLYSYLCFKSIQLYRVYQASQWLSGKESTCNAGDLGSIPGLGRSPGEGNGNPLQYSCLENPKDGGAWWATVQGVAKSQTWLSDFTFTFTFIFISNYIKK